MKAPAVQAQAHAAMLLPIWPEPRGRAGRKRQPATENHRAQMQHRRLHMRQSAVRMLGMCCFGMAAMPAAISLRRAHSPAAINNAEKTPARKMRTPGPSRPCSMVKRTRKMPPSASARPPIQTTHCVPNFSSSVVDVAGAGATGGGATAAGSTAGATGSAGVTAPGAGVETGVSGVRVPSSLMRLSSCRT